MNHPFRDRKEAGVLLARRLREEISTEQLLLIALPRGGMVIAGEISRALKLPIEPLIVRKIGAPEQPELAIGAISSGGFIYLNDEIIRALGIDARTVEAVRSRELMELERREERYGIKNGSQLKAKVEGTRVLIVDDGVATGATMKVAIRALRAMNPKYLAIAVPVASMSIVEEMHRSVDAVFALRTPMELGAVGEFYENFAPVSDDEVLSILNESRRAIDDK